MRAPLALMLLAAPAAAAAERVDVALVLAVDISLSMDPDEQVAQRDGYLSALVHPEVLDAIGKGLRGRIAVTYVEWGGPYDQRAIAPWRVIDELADAEAFAAEIAFSPPRVSRGTSISGALDFALRHFEEAPPADRLVIDVSGDGPNNQGGPVVAARDRALARGVEINGLPLTLKAPDVFSTPDLDRYYVDCVIGGPAPFVIPIRDPSEFADAIRRKLILEIAGARPPGALSDRLAAVPAQAPIDCEIGEKLYERWRRSLDWN